MTTDRPSPAAAQPAAEQPAAEQLADGVELLLRTFDQAPMGVLGRDMTLLGWNHLAHEVFAGHLPFDAPWSTPGGLSWARLLFLDERIRASRPDGDEATIDLVGRLRASHARNPADAALTRLINELSTASERFATLWGFFHNLGFFGSTHWYEYKLTLAPDPPYDNSGSISGSAMTQNLTLEMDAYDYGPHVELDPEDECPTSTLACHAVMDLDLSGAWVTSLRSAVLDGTGTIDTPVGFCPDTAMVAFLDGATVALDSLLVDFV